MASFQATAARPMCPKAVGVLLLQAWHHAACCRQHHIPIACAQVVRFLSGLSTWIVSLWQPGRRATLRKSWQAWGQPRMARPSFLNAVVEALYPPTSPAVHTAEGWPWNLGNFGMHSSGLSQQQAHDAETFLQPSGERLLLTHCRLRNLACHDWRSPRGMPVLLTQALE